MALVKIGEEFERGTDTRGQTVNNWGGNDGQQTNQRQIISCNIERCKWCNRPGHTMSNFYVTAKPKDESNVMEQAQVESSLPYQQGDLVVEAQNMELNLYKQDRS